MLNTGTSIQPPSNFSYDPLLVFRGETWVMDEFWGAESSGAINCSVNTMATATFSLIPVFLHANFTFKAQVSVGAGTNGSFSLGLACSMLYIQNEKTFRQFGGNWDGGAIGTGVFVQCDPTGANNVLGVTNAYSVTNVAAYIWSGRGATGTTIPAFGWVMIGFFNNGTSTTGTFTVNHCQIEFGYPSPMAANR